MDNNPDGEYGQWMSSSEDPSAPRVPDHHLLYRIGRGSYGEIWLARNIMGTYRAVKVVFRAQFEEQRPFEREFSGIQRFEPISRSHPGFVDILQIGKNAEDGYFYYVMEVADDLDSGNEIDPENYRPKTLRKAISTQGRMPYETCLQIGLALTDALGYLHDHDLIHRDIKPSNIVFVNGIPKLADIGLVAEIGSSRSYVGTDGFIPPDGPGTVQADIFSLGKVLYEVNTGLDRQSFPELPTDVNDAAEESGIGEMNHVVLKACAENPKERYKSTAEMRSDLILLQAGKSLRRLRALERRFALLVKSVLVLAGILGVAGAIIFEVNRRRQQYEEMLQREVGSFLARGAQAMDSGDLSGALPWLAEAYHIDTPTPIKEETHRLRFGSVLQRSASMEQIWFHHGPVNHAEFVSSNLVLIRGPGTNGLPRLYNVDTGKPESDASFGVGTFMERASISPNGDLVVTSGEEESTIRIWDRTTGELAIAPIDAGSGVWDATFGPQGDCIIGALEDGNAVIWSSKTGEKEMVLAGHTDVVRHAELSASGDRAVTCSYDGTALIWSTQTGEIITQLSGHRSWVSDAASTPAALLWTTQSGQVVTRLVRHRSWVYDATFSPGGKYVATGSFDRTARIWDAESGIEILRVHHDDGIRDVEFSPKFDDDSFAQENRNSAAHNWLMTVGWDRKVNIWSIAEPDISPELVTSPIRDNGRPMAASFSPDGNKVIVVNWNGTARVWEMPEAIAPPELNAAEAYSFSANGKRRAEVTSGTITIRDTVGENVVAKIPSQSDRTTIRLNAAGDRLLTVSKRADSLEEASQYAQLWTTELGNAVTQPFPVSTPLTNVALSPSGDRAAFFSAKTLEVWSTIKPKRLSTIPITNAALTQVTFGPKGEWLATASGRKHESTPKEARVWNSTNGNPITDPISQDVHISSLAFNPDRTLLATACSEGSLNPRAARLWSLDSGDIKLKGTPLRHLDGVTHVEFGPDGKRIVTTGEDKRAIIWDVETTQPITAPIEHDHQINYAGFGQNGHWLITASRDGIARIWNASTGHPITPPFRHGSVQLYEARLIGDHRKLLTIGTTKNGTVKHTFVWDLPRADGSIEHLENVASVLSGQRTYIKPGAMIPLTSEELRDYWQEYQETTKSKQAQSAP